MSGAPASPEPAAGGPEVPAIARTPAVPGAPEAPEAPKAPEAPAVPEVYWRTLFDRGAEERHRAWLASKPGGQRLIVLRKATKLAQLVGYHAPLAGLFDVTLRLCNFTLATLSGLEAERTTFERCELEFARLDQARLTGCSFIDCHGVGVHLEGVLVRGGTFRESSLARTTWTGAECVEVGFDDVWFNGAALAGARFVRCRFPGARFEGADLGGATFIECDLRGASYAGATLDGAQFEGSTGAP